MRLVLFQIGQNIQRQFRVRLQILALDEQARLLHQSLRIPGFRGFQYIILVQFPVRLHADALPVIAGQPLETAYVLLFHQGGGCRHGRGQKLLPFRRLLHIPCHGFIIIGQLVQCRQAAEFHSLFPELHGFRIDGFRGRGLAFPAGRGHPGRNGSGIRRSIFPLTLLFRFPEPRRSVGVLSVQGQLDLLAGGSESVVQGRCFPRILGIGRLVGQEKQGRDMSPCRQTVHHGAVRL